MISVEAFQLHFRGFSKFSCFNELFFFIEILRFCLTLVVRKSVNKGCSYIFQNVMRALISGDEFRF